MPPRKKQLSDIERRRLISEHRIHFEGPPSTNRLPEKHKHHFYAIDEIKKVRYDEYKKNKKIPKERKDDLTCRIRYLREQATNLLNDFNTNEPTWRFLEDKVLHRFDMRVICSTCRNESWISDYPQADFRNFLSSLKLVEKRQRRKPCCCKDSPRDRIITNTDDENRTIFAIEKDARIAHASGDNLDRFSISMIPDMVIGLRSTTSIPSNTIHYPIVGKGTLLPFLVVEAKREENAPGFRAIQHQTAFPIRSLLKAQNDLFSRDPSGEPCLVWFFAYQGEAWRIYCCTYENEDVRMYDLWQGTLQSQDSALQLLLIVDYIWSWARDVYRPTIRNLQSRFVQSSRDFSPGFIDRFRRSISVSSRPSSAPTNYSQESTGIASTIFNTRRTYPQTIPRQVEHVSQVSQLRNSLVKDASSHDFLKWAIGHDGAFPWTKMGSVRYSNIVHFELRCYEIAIPDLIEVKQPNPDDYLMIQKLAQWRVYLLPNELQKLAKFWTNNPAPIPNIHLDRQVEVSFLLQTYCNRSTWQITRILHCMIWRARPLRVSGGASPNGFDERPVGSFSDIEIRLKLVQAQKNAGKTSVCEALQNASYVLIPNLRHLDPSSSGLEWKVSGAEWIEFDAAGIPANARWTLKHLTSCISVGDFVIDCVNICSGLLEIDESASVRGSHRRPQSERSLLAVRPRNWPHETSKFCLFVFSKEDFYGDNIDKLLAKVMKVQDVRNKRGYRPLNQSDRECLRRWRRALET